MSIFSSIKDAIFGHSVPHPAANAREAAPPPAVDSTAAPGMPAPAPTSSPAHTPVIDVANHLDSIPGADHLNWRTSIVDLMKLIGVPSDFESRQALAHELGRADYAGSAEDNVWLHKTVMQQLAANGGNVPAALLD
jgi:hypothetical protein